MEESFNYITTENIKDKLKDITDLEEKVNKLIEEKNSNSGFFYSIMTFYYPDNFRKIKEIYYYLLENKLAKFRHAKIVLDYYLKTSEKDAIEFYYHSIKPFIPLESNFISYLLEQKSSPEFQKILLDFIGKRVILPEIFPFVDIRIKPEKIKINSDLLLKKLDNYIAKKVSPDKLYQFKFIINKDVSYLKKPLCVIDGNNYLLTEKGEITLKTTVKLKFLIDLLSKSYQVMIFIHQRHQTKINQLCSFLNHLITFTPASFNDDWFSLYFAIKNNAYILSNDNFKDHIFLFDTLDETDDLKNFLETHQIKYRDKLIMPLNYSKVIQGNSSHILIPGISGFFLKSFL